MLLIVSFSITIAFVIGSVYFLLTERKSNLKRRIETFVGTDKSSVKRQDEKTRLLLKEKILVLRDKTRVLKDKTGAIINKRLDAQKEVKLEKKLLQLGNPWGITSADFQLYIFIFQICVPVLFVIYGLILRFKFPVLLILLIAGGGLALVLPDYYINTKIAKRNKQALRELPDFLDLLTVSLEAGLGFDLALNKVISKRNGILSSEFHICLEEMRLGKTRKEALTGVKERLDFDELKSLINSILQAEKLGISIVQIFRIKSGEERDKRKQRAEEEAMKAPIKILFPLVLFVFPSIFIVILGPVVIQFVKVFSTK